jgi:hypothetical protein
MLKIPSGDDVPPPLMVPVKRMEAGADPEHEGMVKRHRRGSRKHAKPKEQSWDSQPVVRSGGRRHEKRQMGWFLAGGVLLLGLIVGGAVIATNRKTPVVAQPVLAPEAVAPSVVDETRNEAQLAAELGPLAEKFLQANTIEALLPLVRHPQVTAGRMKELYPTGKLTAPGISKFNAAELLSSEGKIFSTLVTTGDFQTREMAFEETPDGIKVDWESWVGWSDMPWQDFRTMRPDSPKVFRVILEPVAYYNFGFGDEEKWQSYRLISPDGEQSIYGYVAKGSELEVKVRPDLDVKQALMTLQLKFPPAATTDNQVEITGFLANGWVQKEESK